MKYELCWVCDATNVRAIPRAAQASPAIAQKGHQDHAVVSMPVRTQAKLREAANSHMMRLEQNPERVISYFQDRRAKYAV